MSLNGLDGWMDGWMARRACSGVVGPEERALFGLRTKLPPHDANDPNDESQFRPYLS